MSSTDTDIIIEATIAINAPASRVFDALADPRQRIQWWGAEGKFHATEMESDLRPGGAWCMRGLGMGDAPFSIRGEYRVVEPPHLLEFTWQANWEDAETVVRVTLDEQDGCTTVRLLHAGFASDTARDRYQGWPWLLSMLRGHVEAAA